MASGALFGSQSGGRSSSKNLIEFKAGKMEMKGNMVHPDTRKGSVYIYQAEDSLMHFCWKDRKNGTVEDDLILFPDDTEFVNVKQCTTGRVYLLKFKLSSRRMFFWIQEPKEDKDEENCKKVNEYLNNPRAATRSANKASSAASTVNSLPQELLQGIGSDSDLQNLLGNMSQQQLMQLLGGMGGLSGLTNILGQSGASTNNDARPGSVISQDSTSTPSRLQPSWTPSSKETPASGGKVKTPSAPVKVNKTSAGKASSSGVQLSDLSTILTGLGATKSQSSPIDLSTALTPDIMHPILKNTDIQKHLTPLLPNYGDLPVNSNELNDTTKSAQFKQAMSSFSEALSSGVLGPIMAQFNLGDEVIKAATKGDLEEFAIAMQKSEKKTELGKGEEVKKTEDVDKKTVEVEKKSESVQKKPDDMDVD